MKIKKVKSGGEYCYPATIAAAVKDANFQKSDGTVMTQGEINTQVKTTTDNLDSTKANKTEVVNTVEIDGDYLKVVKGTSTNNLIIPNSTKWDGVSQDGTDGQVLTMQDGKAVWADSSTPVTKDYIDLSLRDIYGATLSSRSTANCYVIKEAGDYKLPLIYGNAIKNGAVNSAAYTKASGATSNASDFVNAFNNVITQPYILNDTIVTSAQLSVADVDGVFTDITIKDGFLCFTVASAPASGANGVISVKDPYDNIVWSWHIWLYPEDLTTYPITSTGGTSYQALSECLGTFIEYPSGVRNRFCMYYQFGRPTPFMRQYYKEKPATNYGVSSYDSIFYRTQYLNQSITNPTTLFTNQSLLFWSYKEGCNLWDASATDYGESEKTTVKTVYDPCPSGFKVGNTYIYMGLTNYSSNTQGGYFYQNGSNLYLYIPYVGYYQNQIYNSMDHNTGIYYFTNLHGCQQVSSGWQTLKTIGHVYGDGTMEGGSIAYYRSINQSMSVIAARPILPIKE